MSSIVESARSFKKKYPLTIAFRLRANSSVVETHLNPDEKPLYTFVGQKTKTLYDSGQTAVVTITNKRILVGRKKLFGMGYVLNSITPDMFNDLKVESGPIFGAVYIDTFKELVVINYLQKSALSEIETNISETMMHLKRKYPKTEQVKK